MRIKILSELGEVAQRNTRARNEQKQGKTAQRAARFTAQTCIWRFFRHGLQTGYQIAPRRKQRNLAQRPVQAPLRHIHASRRILKIGVRGTTFSDMTWHGFNLVDAVALALLLAGLIGGIRRGLSGELARVMVALVCIFVVYHYTRPFAKWLQDHFHWEAHLALLGGVLALLLGAYIAATLIRMLLSTILNFAFKGKLERIGGALAGLLRSAITVTLFLLLVSFIPNDTVHRVVNEESASGRLVSKYVSPWYDKMAEKMPDLRLPERHEEKWDEDAFEQKLDKWESENEPLGPVSED